MTFAGVVFLGVAGCHREDQESHVQANSSSQLIASEEPAHPDRSAATIYASTWILRSLTHSLINSRERVEYLAPLDADPARHRPSVEQVLALQKARLIILNGADFEEGLKSVSLPITRVFKSAHHLRTQWLHYPERFSKSEHQHGPEGAHSHRGVDGHTWLDPQLLRDQLDALYNRLKKSKLAPSDQAYKRLVDRLDQLDQHWRALKPHLKRRALLSNHPAYQYVARRYQLKIKALDLPPDSLPDEAQRDELSQEVKRARALDPHLEVLMLWESTPSEVVREAYRGLKLTHVTLHTLERPSNTPSLREITDPLELYARDLESLSHILSVKHETAKPATSSRPHD